MALWRRIDVLVVLWCVIYFTFNVNGLKISSLGVKSREELRNLQSSLNSSNLDFLLSQISLEVPTEDIPNDRITQNFFGGNIKYRVFLGGAQKNPGFCSEFALTDSISIESKELSPENGLERVEFNISGSGLSFLCDIPLRVEIDELVIGFIPIDLGGFQDNANGQLFINTVDGISWQQSLVLESPDFTKSPPIVSTPGDCSLQVGNLAFNAVDVLAIFDNLLPNGINLDNQLENALRRDGTLLTEPIGDFLCNFTLQLAQTFGDTIVANPLTNVGPGTIISGGGFFDADNNGQIDALDLEEEIISGLDDVLLDLSENNFLVDLLFPQNSQGELNILEQFFQSFEIGGVNINQTDAVGFLIALLNDAFDLELEPPLIDLDLVPIIAQVVNLTDFVVNEEDTITLVIANDTFLLEDFLEVDIELVSNKLVLSEFGGTSDDVGIFTGAEVFGQHSLILPTFDLGDYFIEAELELDFGFRLNVSGAGASAIFPPELEILELTFDKEVIQIEINVENLFGEVAGLLAISEDRLNNLTVGALVSNALNCTTSVLATDAVLTGVGVSVDNIEGSIFGFKDLLMNFAGDVANSLLLSYQSVIARAFETFLASALLGDGPFVIFPQSECEIEEVGNDANKLFDFSEAFKEFLETADEEFFEEIISFALNEEDGIVSLIEAGEPTEISFNFIPSGDGLTQKISIIVSQVDVFGIAQPEVLVGDLSVPETSPFFPQGIVADLKLGSTETRLGADVSFTIEISEPFLLEEESTPGFVLEVNSTNEVSLNLDFDTIDAFIEIFASITNEIVDSTDISDAANLDCWVSHLEPFGGVQPSSFLIANVSVVQASCNCESSLLNESIALLNAVEGLSQVNQDVGDVLNSLLGSVSAQFDEDNFAFTVANAALACIGEPVLPKLFVAEDEDITGPLVVTSLVVFVMFMIPCKVSLFFSRPTGDEVFSQTKDLKASDEREEVAAIKAFEKENGDKSVDVAMFQNEHTPKKAKFVLPVLIIANLGLLILSLTQVLFEVSVDGNFLEGIQNEESLATFTIFEILTLLFESPDTLVVGAIALLLLIGLPFLRFMVMIVSFFTSILSIKWRARLLLFIDSLSFWSLAIVVVLAYTKSIYQFKLNSARRDYLPEEALYSLDVAFDLQEGLYLYIISILLSHCVSNWLFLNHEKIVLKNDLAIRRDILNKDTSTSILIPMELKSYEFYVAKKNSPNFTYKMTERGSSLFNFCTVLCVILTFISSAVIGVNIQYVGMVNLILRAEDLGTTFDMSLFTLIGQLQDGTFGPIILALLFLIFFTLLPIAHLCSSFLLLNRRVSLKTGKQLAAWRDVMSSWVALEVLVFTLAYSVVGIPVVVQEISSTECSFLSPIMITLHSVGLVSTEDVENLCIGTNEELQFGALFMLFVLLLNSLHSFFIRRIFDKMIKQRQKFSSFSRQKNENQLGQENENRVLETPKLSWILSKAKSMKLIKVMPKDEAPQI